MVAINKQSHKRLIAMFSKDCFLEIFFILTNISLIVCRQEFSPTETTNEIARGSSATNRNRASNSNAEEDHKLPNGETIPVFCTEYVNKQCSELPADCLNCDFNKSCIYGAKVNTTCTLKKGVKCVGSQRSRASEDEQVIKEHRCAYCYQLPTSEYDCLLSANCRGNSRYQTNCSVHRDVMCLGTRVFPKFLTCNFVSGYKWSTALILSITLGGFGVDRFYLGNWQEGIGKLFSFGGLGVWTLVDIILIATGYLKPADGSRYM